jgi:YVTN family beta-propeller protein
MKSRTKQSLMMQLNSQNSFTTTWCKPSNGTSYQLLHRTIWQQLSIVLFLLLSMGVGLGHATAQAQTRAYLTNGNSATVSVIDTGTNAVVVTIPVGPIPFAVAITPDGPAAADVHPTEGKCNIRAAEFRGIKVFTMLDHSPLPRSAYRSSVRSRFAPRFGSLCSPF